MTWAGAIFLALETRRVETPNIDRLAAEGLRFEQFYVNSPVCSPTAHGNFDGAVSTAVADHFVSGQSAVERRTRDGPLA